jgi:hypothetical protein
MGRREFLLRMEDDEFEAARKAAAEAGLSMNAWLCQAAQEKLAAEHLPRPADYREALQFLAETAGKLGNGFVLVPGTEVPGSAWDQLMNRAPQG